MVSKHIRLALMISACTVASGTASAQTIDYGSLEMLFGEPVTTSVTGKPQRASEAPASLIIVSDEELRRTGAIDLGHVLQNYAGIDVNRFGAADYQMTVRGGNQGANPRILTLVNGRQVYLDHYGYTNWSGLGIQLEDIKQVEIVKGPNSALFGFNAAVGVVNIVTYNPLYTEKTTVRVEGGTHDQFYTSGMISKKVTDKVGVRLSAGFSNMDEFDDAGTNDDARRHSVALDTMVQLTPKTQLNVEATYNNSHNQYASPFDYTAAVGEYQNHSVKAQYFWESPIGLLDAMAYLNQALIATNGLSFDNSTFVGRVQDIFKIGTNNSFRIATEYRHNTIDFDPNTEGTVFYDVVALSGMYERVVSDSVTATLAVRLDHLMLGQDGAIVPTATFTAADFDRSITEYSFNAGAVWKASDKDSFRIAGGRGLQLPSLFAFGFSLPFPSGGLTSSLNGDPTLDASVVYSAELGYDRKVEELDSTFSLTAFYEVNEDLILFPGLDVVVAPPVIFLNVGSRGDFKSYGLEAALNGEKGPFKWGANYTLNFIDETVPLNGAAILVPEAFDGLTPTHKINLRGGYQKGPFTADAYIRYRSKTDSITQLVAGTPFTQVRNDGNVSADVRLAYRAWEGAELFVTGENIFNAEDSALGNQGNEARFRLGFRMDLQ